MSQGCKGTRGRPTSVTMDDLEECFNSLATAAVAENDDLRDLVEADLALTKTAANLTDTNARLVEKIESWTNSSGGGEGGGGGGNRRKGKWCKNYNRKTWHEEDKCFEFEKNKSLRPNHWKSVL